MSGVVVTRDEPVDGALSSALERLGAEVLHWPVLRIVPPRDVDALARALGRLSRHAWVVYTSANAVAAVTALRAPPRSSAARPRIAAVGAATARALRAKGWPVDLVARTATARSLLRALVPHIRPGDRILLPQSAIALPTLADGLAAAGARVTTVTAYSTRAIPLDAAACRRAIRAGRVGAVTFASPSAVDALERALGSRTFRTLLTRAPAVAIGPTTAASLGARNIPATMAKPHSLRALATAAHRLVSEADRS